MYEEFLRGLAYLVYATHINLAEFLYDTKCFLEKEVMITRFILVS